MADQTMDSCPSIVISGERVYKLFAGKSLYYKILRESAVFSKPGINKLEWSDNFIMYEIRREEYYYILHAMEQAGYHARMNPCNENIVRYLQTNFSHKRTQAKNGVDLYALMDAVRKHLSFDAKLNLEEK